MTPEEGRRLREEVARLERLANTRDAPLDQLRLWADAAAQGVDSADVRSFGFNLSFVPKNKRPGPGVGLPSRDKYPWYDSWVTKPGKPEWYNYVRTQDGSIRVLDPMIKAPRSIEEEAHD